MLRKRVSTFLLIIVLTFIAGCQQQPTATSIPPTAPEATATDVATTMPTETATVIPTATESPSPTPEPSTPTPTLAATATPTEEPTPEPAALSIATPTEGTTLEVGSSIAVNGEAPAGTETISVTLRAAGLALAESQVTLAGDEASWETTLAVPASVTGPALVRAAAGEETVEVPVQISRSGATSAPTISLTYPQADSTVAAGRVLFFTGRVQQPTDDTVSIAVLYEDCQTVAASTNFNVGQGGQWWGYVLVPETVVGPACAVAYFGQFGQGEWRAAQTPVTILEAGAPQAQGLFLGNFAGSTVTPGEAIAIYGSAFDVANRQVQVSLEIDGTAVAQGTATADRFGYWEISLTPPADLSTTATGQIVAVATADGEEYRESVPFDVVP